MSLVLDEEFSCPVCLEQFDTGAHEPRSLGCGHTLCTQCTDQIKSILGPGHFGIRCPTCRELMTYNGRLPTNFAIRNAAESIKRATANQQPRETVQDEGEQRQQCHQCKKIKSQDDVMSCEQCQNVLLCVVCSLTLHHGHKLVPFQAYQANKLRLETQERVNALELDMRRAQDEIRPRLDRLVKACSEIQRNWHRSQFPNKFRDLAAKVECRDDATQLLSQYEDLVASYLAQLTECSATVEKAEQEMNAIALSRMHREEPIPQRHQNSRNSREAMIRSLNEKARRLPPSVFDLR